jgi:AcrR family transcriptional regulator
VNLNPSKRRTRAERQEQTRGELIAAAAKVFARRGYLGASVEEIAEEAGYSHGAVYSNFEGKAELFVAVFEEYVAGRVREIARVGTETDGPLVQRAQAIADQWMRDVAEDSETLLLQLEFVVHTARNPELRERFARRTNGVRLAIETHLENDQRDRGIPLALPPSDLALVLHALGNGLALETLRQPDAVPADLYGRFVKLLLSLLEEHAMTRGRTRAKRDGE